MEINAQIPAFYFRESIIQASREEVYQMLVMFHSWPLWQSGVKMLDAPEKAEPGASFRWSNGGMPITSEVTEAVYGERIEWTSRAMWISANISWELETVPEGTLVRYAQSLEGFGALFMRGVLIKSMKITLLELKRFCETALAYA